MGDNLNEALQGQTREDLRVRLKGQLPADWAWGHRQASMMSLTSAVRASLQIRWQMRRERRFPR